MSKNAPFQNLILQKYCANGNDFLIFHTFMQGDFSELAKRLCDRFYGIGADGLVVVLPQNPTKDSTKEHTKESSPKSTANVAYKWDFYNSDGSKASMCGNASRCVGHYAFCFGLAGQRHSFLSEAGIISIEVDGDIVQSNLGKFHSLKKLGKLKEIVSLKEITNYMEEGKSSYAPALKAIKESKDSSFDLALRWAMGDFGKNGDLDKDFGQDFVEDSKELAHFALDKLEMLKNSEWFYLNTGVPHLVCFLSEDLLPNAKDNAQNKPILAILRKKFDANATIAHKVDDKRVKFASFERGVEAVTLSCGSGMAAALVVGYRFFGIDSKAMLIPPSGEPTQVSEDSEGYVYLRGAVWHIASCNVSANLLSKI